MSYFVLEHLGGALIDARYVYQALHEQSQYKAVDSTEPLNSPIRKLCMEFKGPLRSELKSRWLAENVVPPWGGRACPTPFLNHMQPVQLAEEWKAH